MRILLALVLAVSGCQSKTDAEPAPAKKSGAEKAAPTPTTAPGTTAAPTTKSTTKPTTQAAPAPKVVDAVPPALLEDVPADTTIAIGGLVGLDALVRAVDSIVAVLPADVRKDAPPEVLDPKARALKLGADLTKPEGWRTLGVDPEGGVAVALDSRLPKGPVIYLRLTDRAALIKTLRGLGLMIEEKGETAGVTEYGVNNNSIWVAKRGKTTVAVPRKMDQAEANLQEVLPDLLRVTPGLLEDPVAKRVFEDLGEGARSWSYGSVDRLLKFAASQGEVLPDADFFAKRFRAVGFAAGPAGGGFRLLTDKKGAAALAKIFQPSKPTADFGRYLPASGVLLGRATINLAEAFDGVADLVPPSQGGVRGKIMLGKNAVPVAAGVQLADLAKAFTGHIGVTTSPSAFSMPQPPFMVMLDIADSAAADQVIDTLIKRLVSTQKVPTAPVELAGHAGTQVGAGRGEVVVIRHANAALIGTASMVEAALKNNTHATGALADAANAEQMYGFVADLDVISRLSPDDKLDPAAFKQISKVVFSGLVEGHLVGGFVRDDEGVVASSGQASVMVMGVLAAIAIPAFMKYINRAKTSEARINLARLSAAAQMAMLERDSAPSLGLAPAPFKLLGAARTPAKACDDQYPSNPEAWKQPGWAQVKFAVDGPHYYQYEIVVNDDMVTLRAVGDLDCDGTESVFEMNGKIADGRLDFGPMSVTNELE